MLDERGHEVLTRLFTIADDVETGTTLLISCERLSVESSFAQFVVW
ncbi:hypothetical protein J2W18_000279 [Rhodococcus cercidiphylli]|nr:hypothetical protein [Rhodococcus cercidiphylli]